MQRTPNGPSRPQTNTANSEITAHKSNAAARAQQHDQVGTFWDMLAIRVVFTAICVAAGFHFRPFSVSREAGALTGFLFALAVILFEVRLRRASMRRLIGAATGSILGILGRVFHDAGAVAHVDAGEHAVIFQPGDFSGDGVHRADSGRE